MGQRGTDHGLDEPSSDKGDDWKGIDREGKTGKRKIQVAPAIQIIRPKEGGIKARRGTAEGKMASSGRLSATVEGIRNSSNKRDLSGLRHKRKRLEGNQERNRTKGKVGLDN